MFLFLDFVDLMVWSILIYGFFFVWARKCFYSLIEGFEKYWGFEYCIYCVAGSPGLNLVNHGELQ